MMKVFLTSDLKNYNKVDGKYLPKEIDNENGLLDDLKESLKGNKSIVFIASSKDNYEKTDSYAKVLFESLKLSGINFENYYIIDSRFNDNIENVINNANMIFLAGGDTLKQHKFFDEINLTELLKNYGGVLMGISAGAINLEYDVYNSPECHEDLKKESKWTGLKKSHINIEPHFVYSDKDFDEGKKLQRKEVLKESYNRVSYGLCNGSHIFIDDENAKVCGKCYKIENGEITLICDDKEEKSL